VGNIGMFRYDFRKAFLPVAEFAKIPRAGPARAWLRGGTLACSATIGRSVFPVAEFAKIPFVGPAMAGAVRGNIGMFRYDWADGFFP
jgi:hypothetical protein